MNIKEAYKFCPKCGGKLISEKDNLSTCSSCGFRFYFNSLPCNAVIIENEKEEIMLVKRAVEPHKGMWDLPGGFVNLGEGLEDSTKREIKEELGVEIKIGKIIGVYVSTYEYQDINFNTFCVVVSGKVVSGEINYQDDISGFEFFSKKEVLKQDLAFDSLKDAISDYLKKEKRG